MEKTGRCSSAERGRGYGYSVIRMEDNLLPPFWWYSFSDFFSSYFYFFDLNPIEEAAINVI